MRARVVLMVLALAALHASAIGAAECVSWPNGQSLQQTVLVSACVQVAAGVHTLSGELLVPPGRTIIGAGQDLTVLRADASVFPLGLETFLLRVSPESGPAVTVQGVTLDGAGVATYTAGRAHLFLLGVRLTRGACAGLGIAGAGVTVAYSQVDYPAHHTDVPGRGTVTCASTPGGVDLGAGIYLADYGWTAPLIVNSVFLASRGPAIDCFRTHGGRFTGNEVREHTGSAGVSLYECDGWVIDDNVLVHGRDEPPQNSHADCYPGSGPHAAAIWLCGTDGTAALRNTWDSWYGLSGARTSGVVVEGNTGPGVVEINTAPAPGTSQACPAHFRRLGIC